MAPGWFALCLVCTPTAAGHPVPLLHRTPTLHTHVPRGCSVLGPPQRCSALGPPEGCSALGPQEGCSALGPLWGCSALGPPQRCSALGPPWGCSATRITKIRTLPRVPTRLVASHSTMCSGGLPNPAAGPTGREKHRGGGGGGAWAHLEALGVEAFLAFSSHLQPGVQALHQGLGVAHVLEVPVGPEVQHLHRLGDVLHLRGGTGAVMKPSV